MKYSFLLYGLFVKQVFGDEYSARMSEKQCFVSSDETIYSEDREANPIFGGGGFIGSLTLDGCKQACDNNLDSHDRPCVAFEWSDGGDDLSATDLRNCALAWGCSSTGDWDGGSVFMREMSAVSAIDDGPPTCVTPPMDPLIDLDGRTYSGSGPWISSVDGFSCQLGSTSTFVSAENSFEFDGSNSKTIDCEYNISPSRHPKLSIEVVFYYEGKDGLGWIVGSDNGGYDRAVIISDTRFGGIAQGIGRSYNSNIDYPSTGAWHHVVIVYDQNVNNGSFLTLDGAKGNTITANNNESRDSFSIGGDNQHNNHSFDGYIRKVAVYDKALSDNDIANMYADSCVSTGTCDQPNGGGCSQQTVSPSSNGAYGDPHIKTWSGEKFDFHGVCDLVLLCNAKFNKGAGLDVHIRNKKIRQWSYVDSAAVRIGTDTLEVRGGEKSNFWINGIQGNSNTDKLVIADYPIKYQNISENSKSLLLVLETTTVLSLRRGIVL
jgi:hypothetical protein